MSDEERSGDGKALCLWCGEDLPLLTPETAGQIIEHLGRCQKHPMREVERERDGYHEAARRLRNAMALATPDIAMARRFFDGLADLSRRIERERDSARARVEALETALRRAHEDVLYIRDIRRHVDAETFNEFCRGTMVRIETGLQDGR